MIISNEISESARQEQLQRKVIYTFPKSLWRYRTYIDITLVKHIKQNCIELIAYSPALDMEAPRYYFDISKMEEKLKAKIDQKVAERREQLLRKHLPATEVRERCNEYYKEAAQDMICQAIVARTELKARARRFTVQINKNFGDKIDETTDRLDFLRDKPEESVAARVEHFSQPRRNVFANFGVSTANSVSMKRQQSSGSMKAPSSPTSGKRVHNVVDALKGAFAATFFARLLGSKPTASDRWFHATRKIIIRNQTAYYRMRVAVLYPEYMRKETDDTETDPGDSSGIADRPITAPLPHYAQPLHPWQKIYHDENEKGEEVGSGAEGADGSRTSRPLKTPNSGVHRPGPDHLPAIAKVAAAGAAGAVKATKGAPNASSADNNKKQTVKLPDITKTAQAGAGGKKVFQANFLVWGQAKSGGKSGGKGAGRKQNPGNLKDGRRKSISNEAPRDSNIESDDPRKDGKVQRKSKDGIDVKVRSQQQQQNDDDPKKEAEKLAKTSSSSPGGVSNIEEGIGQIVRAFSLNSTHRVAVDG